MRNDAMLKRIAFVAAFAFSAVSHAQVLHGVGSTTQYPLFSEWARTYHHVDPAVKLHYSPTGSAKGVEEFLDGKADFVATDELLSDDQLKAAKAKLGSDILRVPMVLGAV